MAEPNDSDTGPDSSANDINDLKAAIAYAADQFAAFHQAGEISEPDARAVAEYYGDLLARIEAGEPLDFVDIQLVPPGKCWSCGRQIEAASFCTACDAPLAGADELRFINFTIHEIHKHTHEGRLQVVVGHHCQAKLKAKAFTLRRQLEAGRTHDRPRRAKTPPPPPPREQAAAGRGAGSHGTATGGEEASAGAAGAEAEAQKPKSPPLLEVLLDPRSIQWLLAIGGVMSVLGVVIYLVAKGFFENPLNAAMMLGAGNALLLGGGWAVVLRTRYRMAGKALTLLACLALPLNLWFYSAQGLITISGGGLWVPALIICILYAGSAAALRDAAFVYALVGGIVLTGLLILADRNPDRFWQVTAPTLMLVIIGLICIHVERAFPVKKGDFARENFGLAFFFSGHACLAAGLLLLLGAQLSGGMFYPYFEAYFAHWGVERPDVAHTFKGRVLAAVLVLLGTYAYIYSDLVVRRIGIYLSLALLSFLWAEVLLIGMLPIELEGTEIAIIALAATGLVINLALGKAAETSEKMLRWARPMAITVGIAPAVLGVYLYLRAVPGIIEPSYTLGWTFVISMIIAAACSRVGAFIHRQRRKTEGTYLFATGACLMVGLVGLLMTINPELLWHERAPIVMLVPIAYVVAGRLSRGTSRGKALFAVAHTAVGVMLFSSILTAFRGFLEARQEALNLYLSLFFAEAALFYVLTVAFGRGRFMGIRGAGVQAATAMAIASVWQLHLYFDLPAEVYILGFGSLGVVLLVAYRLATLEKLKIKGLAEWAFWSGTAMLLVASAAGALRTLADLAPGRSDQVALLDVLLLPLALGVMNAVAVAIVRHTEWRRAYVVAAITHAGLAVLALAVMSELTFWQKAEIVTVVLGLLLLVIGHVSLTRERDRYNDLAYFSVMLGCLLAGYPLANATLYCRLFWAEFDLFHQLNEAGMLFVGVAMLATGVMLKIRATTLVGGLLTVLWVVTLVFYARLPERLQTTAIYLMIGGGVLFGGGLLLSIYRDRILALPDRIKRREGVFGVLSWR